MTNKFDPNLQCTCLKQRYPTIVVQTQSGLRGWWCHECQFGYCLFTHVMGCKCVGRDEVLLVNSTPGTGYNIVSQLQAK
jgi:hypothetical protein